MARELLGLGFRVLQICIYAPRELCMPWVVDAITSVSALVRQCAKQELSVRRKVLLHTNPSEPYLRVMLVAKQELPIYTELSLRTLLYQRTLLSDLILGLLASASYWARSSCRMLLVSRSFACSSKHTNTVMIYS